MASAELSINVSINPLAKSLARGFLRVLVALVALRALSANRATAIAEAGLPWIITKGLSAR